MSYLGVVTAVTPALMVRGDLSTTPDPAVNMSSVTLVVDDRVDVDQVGKQLHILGTERSGVPAGCTMTWWTATPPVGWVINDGAPKSRTVYAVLFALWGTSFGAGDGSTTFLFPPTPGRVIVGRDPAQTEFAAIGQVGGAKTHTLTTAEMPEHNHLQNAHNHTQDAHAHATLINTSVLAALAAGTDTYGVDNTGTHATSATTATNNEATAVNQVTGGGTAHPILNPYVVAVEIVKT